MGPDRILEGRGSEAPIEAGFRQWLTETGWQVIEDHGTWADVVAEKGGERPVAEVKGYNSSIGTDADTMYGQILRRMEPGAATAYAVVIPTRSLTAVLRVPIDVRRRLGIRVFEVRDDDTVVEHHV